MDFPIARDASATRSATSVSSCELHDVVDPKCLKDFVQVMKPFDTLTSFISDNLPHALFSLLISDTLDSSFGIAHSSLDSDFVMNCVVLARKKPESRKDTFFL